MKHSVERREPRLNHLTVHGQQHGLKHAPFYSYMVEVMVGGHPEYAPNHDPYGSGHDLFYPTVDLTFPAKIRTMLTTMQFTIASRALWVASDCRQDVVGNVRLQTYGGGRSFL